MGENTGKVTLPLEGKRAELFARRIEERDRLAQQEEQLQKMLVNTTTAKIRAQGKCDGIVEMVAEEAGYDFTKVEQYSADTDKQTVILTFLPEDSMEHEHSENKNGDNVVTEFSALKEEKKEVETNAD